MIQVYTGNGKGKTTASLGLCLRAAGHGLKSKVFFFMKGFIEYGELKANENSGGLMFVEQCGRETFVSKDNPDPVDIEMAQDGFKKAKDAIASGEFDIIVLDELNVAIDFGLIPLKEALNLIDNYPKDRELIITGRYCPQEVIDRADLITEMREIRHYYQNGVESRKGIEF